MSDNSDLVVSYNWFNYFLSIKDIVGENSNLKNRIKQLYITTRNTMEVTLETFIDNMGFINTADILVNDRIKCFIDTDIDEGDDRLQYYIYLSKSYNNKIKVPEIIEYKTYIAINKYYVAYNIELNDYIDNISYKNLFIDLITHTIMDEFLYGDNN